MNTSSVSRRDFLRMAAATAGTATLGSALGACGGPATPAKGTVTLTYWDWWQSQAPWVDNEIRLFQQANPGIKVQKTTQLFNNYDDLFALAVKSNKTPDVAMIPVVTPDVSTQIAQGWYLPIDHYASSTWKAQFPSGTFHEGSNIFNGKLYSAPYNTGGASFQLYINNSVFRNAGLTNADGSIKLPQTWDDVTHAAEAIVSKSNGSVYGLGFGAGTTQLLTWWMEVFTRGAGSVAHGGGTPDYRTGKWTYGSDRTYQDFLELFLEWKQKGYMYPDGISASDEAARAAFARGVFGMTVGGVFDQPGWKTNNNFTDYSLVGLVPPAQPLKGYYYKTLGGFWHGIAAHTKYPDEAWAWFAWMNSPDAGKRWVQMGEDLSVFPQDNDPSLVSFAPFSQFVAAAKLALTGPDPSVRNPQTSKVQRATVTKNTHALMVGAYTGQVTDLHAELTALADRYAQALNDGIAKAVAGGAQVSINDYIFSDWDITKPYTTVPKA